MLTLGFGQAAQRLDTCGVQLLDLGLADVGHPAQMIARFEQRFGVRLPAAVLVPGGWAAEDYRGQSHPGRRQRRFSAPGSNRCSRPSETCAPVHRPSRSAAARDIAPGPLRAGRHTRTVGSQTRVAPSAPAWSPTARRRSRPARDGAATRIRKSASPTDQPRPAGRGKSPRARLHGVAGERRAIPAGRDVTDVTALVSELLEERPARDGDRVRPGSAAGPTPHPAERPQGRQATCASSTSQRANSEIRAGRKGCTDTDA